MATATAPSGIAYEPVEGNSLTQFVRSLHDLTGSQGQANLDTGTQQFKTGVQEASPSIDYLTKLVKGDMSDVNDATRPQVDQITQQFDQVRNMISGSPRGGGKAGTLAEQPFQKASAIARVQGDARTKAVGELGTLAGQQAQLGAGQQQLGFGLESLADQDALTMRGQDNGNNFASQFQQITAGIKNLV